MANRLEHVDPTQPAAPPVAAQPDASSSTAPNRLENVDLPAAPAPPAPPPEPAKPDPNAYQSPDWLPGAGFLHKLGDVFDNAFTANTANLATAKAGEFARAHGIQNTTPDVSTLRATTEQNRKDVGPIASTAADIAGYTMGPGKILGPLAGKLAPTIGRYGAAAFEGGAGSALNSAGNQAGNPNGPNFTGIDPYSVARDAGWGSVAGIGGQAAGDVAAAAARPGMDIVKGLPGRGGELWDWRTRYNAGEDINPLIDRYQQYAPPGGPEDVALTKLRSAVNQSVEPGVAAKTVAGVGTLGSGWLGLEHSLSSPWAEAAGAGTIAGAASKWGLMPAAKLVNRVDRYINTGQAFDQAYPALTAQPAATTDTSGWADALRQAWIGQQAGQAGSP